MKLSTRVARGAVHLVLGNRSWLKRELTEFAGANELHRVMEIGSGKPEGGEYVYSMRPIFAGVDEFVMTDVTPDYGHRVLDVTDFTVDEPFETDPTQDGGDRLVRDVQIEQRDVVADRAGDQLDLLGDHRHPGSQLDEGHLTDADPTDAQLARRGLEQTQHEARHRRLSAPGPPDQAERPTGAEAQRHVVEHREAVAVVEVDLVELDLERARRR